MKKRINIVISEDVGMFFATVWNAGMDQFIPLRFWGSDPETTVGKAVQHVWTTPDVTTIEIMDITESFE